MKRLIILFISLALALSVSLSVAQEKKLWVSSDQAKLKAQKSASSETIAIVPLGSEVTVIASEDRWYRIVIPSGEEGWIYRGRLSESQPPKETREESGDLLALVPGSKITADKADTDRSIRGLSNETEQYARTRGTPEQYKRALDKVLAMSVEEKELENFLRYGKIGEYAE